LENTPCAESSVSSRIAVSTEEADKSQIEYHPYVYHADNMRRLTSLCQDEDIMIQCYSPLGPIVHSPGGPVDSVVQGIAKQMGATPAQVLLRWATDYTGGGIVT
jgi:diketogulonate reductase-like aldo/keto reductase